MKFNNKVGFAFLVSLSLASCKKEWLDQKPDNSLAIPSTLNDLQLLSNITGVGSNLAENGTDDFFVTDSGLISAPFYFHNLYLWAQEGLGENSVGDWSTSYTNIFACNSVFDKIQNIAITTSNVQQYNLAFGTASFYRSYYYQQLSQVFCAEYDSLSSVSDLGVPLRLHADIAEKVGRSTVKQLYIQMVGDALNAIRLLPNSRFYTSQPNKVAAYALLSRIYLTMQDYSNAKLYADSTLALSSTLLDYNSISPPQNTATNSMPPFSENPESLVISYAPTDLDRYTIAVVDSNLFSLYDSFDLRKTIFFYTNDKGPHFRGSYGNFLTQLWAGPCIDEVYLIRAECEARSGHVQQAIADLNLLLSARYITGTFSRLTITNPDIALKTILTERRKELCFRGTRWSDLRRLNKDPNFSISIFRVVKGISYTLAPNSNLYIWPIPNDEIIYSGITNNPR